MDPASSAAAVLLLFGMLGPVPAPAQTSAVTSPTHASASKSTPGAYAQLSPANQKIALALYTAQPKTAPAKPLTLDQIAAMKQSGQSWSQVFNTMKARGLMRDKSLAQVVSNANRFSYETSASSMVSASSKAHPKSRPEHSLSANDSASASIGSTDSGDPH